ncbi:hypothetical protein A2U01_0002754 [Trifolium medium]|uniref:Uncharacterized protein n=1 Tax=Trifolium medium TaxID=97028 RepID=A0A392M3P7_9FABA|nr:hypothetical protein [Trifolium medium]
MVVTIDFFRDLRIGKICSNEFDMCSRAEDVLLEFCLMLIVRCQPIIPFLLLFELGARNGHSISIVLMLLIGLLLQHLNIGEYGVEENENLLLLHPLCSSRVYEG